MPLGLALLAACSAQIDGVPEGALARVGDTVIYPEDIEVQHAYLGAYAQRRFSGADGKRAMLEGIISQRLLEVEARERGLQRDPRVGWAPLEELARLQLSAELERRVPTHDVRENQAALRAYYEAHLDDFTEPERRSVRMVRFATLREAEAAHDKVRAGEATLEELGEVVRTTPEARNDHRFPGFHRAMFTEVDTVGQLLPRPILARDAAWVAELHAITPGPTRPFEDPAVQEELVTAVREPLAQAARQALMAELAAAYPFEASGGG